MAGNYKQITFNIDQQSLDVIEDLKEATGRNMGDVMRDAISFYAWAKKQQYQGYNVGVIRRGGVYEKLTLLFKKPKSVFRKMADKMSRGGR